MSEGMRSKLKESSPARLSVVKISLHTGDAFRLENMPSGHSLNRYAAAAEAVSPMASAYLR